MTWFAARAVCLCAAVLKNLPVVRSMMLKWDLLDAAPRLTRSGTGEQTCLGERTCRARIHPRPHPRQTHSRVRTYSHRRPHHKRTLDGRCGRTLDMCASKGGGRVRLPLRALPAARTG